ncbi:MAG: DUF3526 domain-containing protein [Bacteroidota bacterium]
MTQLLIQNFLRSKGLMIGLVLLFFTGLVSLHIGKIFLEQQADIVSKTAHHQEESHQQHLEYEHGEMGLLLYYIRFGLANKTPNISGLSIGHRDIHPSVRLVNIRNLEEQKHATELRNPLYQLLGNLDFSFVLIYLFPLIVIAFCFNLLSEEKEGGTWTLLLSQSTPPVKILRTKLWIRLVSVLSVLITLLVIGKIYLSIPLNAAFLAFTLVAVFYVLFWFALAWFVVSLQKSSSQNALSLLLVWVMLTIILPASINALVINLYPIPEAYSTVIESRDGYHTKWDLPKKPTIQKFKDHYPQFAQYEHPEGQSFGWFWYYAMQQMGDDEAAESNEAMKEKLRKRDQISRTIAYFLPSVHTQFSLNALSQSDMRNYLNFLNELEAFHEEKRLYFYPKIFEGVPIEEENWAQFRLEYVEDDRKLEWFGKLLPLVLGSLLLVRLARRKMVVSETK